MENTDSMLGWHWLRNDKRLRYRDGDEVDDGEIVEAGSTYVAEGPIELCRNGMHASARALDALEYAPGEIVCYVRLEGELQHDTTKSVGRSRTVLWMVDASDTLHEFACWCAAQALSRERDAGREPDARSWAAIEAKRRWLAHEISDDELAAARAAASDAAWAARDAAWDAQNAELERRLMDLAQGEEQ